MFTDDDVRVSSNWFEGMCRPIFDGLADAVAGRIIFPPKVAFALSREPYCSRRSWLASSEYLNPDNPEAMIGANMAFHRRVLQKVSQFDLELTRGHSALKKKLFSPSNLGEGE